MRAVVSRRASIIDVVYLASAHCAPAGRIASNQRVLVARMASPS
jgi:hypothetical protein